MTKHMTLTASPKSFLTNLDAPLLRITDRDHITLRDLLMGTAVFGNSGSGKSSGAGRTFALALLKSGAGGLVLCAKPEEADEWERYAAETGRKGAIIRVTAGSLWRFNFLDYTLRKDGVAASNNAVDVLMRAAEASRLAKDRPGGAGDEFWTNATNQILSNSLLLLYSAYGRITTDELYRFLVTAPQSEPQIVDPAWRAGSFCFATMDRADRAPAIRLSQRELGQIVSYWRYDFARLDPKTRANIIITVTSLLSRFLRGRLHELLCTHTTFVPDLCFEGAIIVVDLPVKTWQEDGIIAQHIIKYLWQRAVERRRADAPHATHRPLFLYADESQFFVNSYDAEFQSTARSSLTATIYLTQSLPTYYAKIGGSHPEHYTNMLLANLTNKLFLANGCHITNRFAADLIGQRIITRRSTNSGETVSDGANGSESLQNGTSTNWGGNSGATYGKDGTFTSSSSSSKGANRGWSKGGGWSDGYSETRGESYSEQKDFKLDPDVFASKLKTGGPRSNGRVEAVWFQPARVFGQTRTSWALTTFLQEGAR